MKFRIVIALLIFILNLSTAPSQDLELGDSYGFFGIPGLQYLVFDLKDSYVFYESKNNNERNEIKWDIQQKASLRIRPDGFPVITVFGKEAIFLFGGNRVAFQFTDSLNNGSVYTQNTLDQIQKEKKWIYSRENNGLIAQCKSNLIENGKNYNIEGTTIKILGESAIDQLMLFNPYTLPWVEGDLGSGIGTKIKITFLRSFGIRDNKFMENKSDSLVIMNGFVDFNRTDLFYKNNRVKEVEIRSTDPNIEFVKKYILSDTPNFQIVVFPFSMHSIELTITDIYRGTKYDDTAITALLTPGFHGINVDLKKTLSPSTFWKK